jgi:hypothetical protein
LSAFVPVKIRWTDAKKNRTSETGRYVTVARFREDVSSWPREAWSIIIEFPPSTTFTEVVKGRARFLVENGSPRERLKSGAMFELLEGNVVMATVQVLAE